MKAFFSLLVISLITISAVLFMPTFPLAAWKYERKLNIPNLILSIVISSSFWAIAIYASIISSDLKLPFILYISTMGFSIVLQINLMVYAKPKVQFTVLSMIIALTFYLTFIFKDVTSGLIGNTLRSYGSGGGVCVTITDTLESYDLKGRLILASPDYIYFKSNGFTSITAVKVDSRTIYKTGNEECSEDT
ncbi:hypothetical protein [Vreelandella boliviensis]|nr:hypothetical protein [Halomonas boliviensis]